jgi:hypothetical protein
VPLAHSREDKSLSRAGLFLAREEETIAREEDFLAREDKSWSRDYFPRTRPLKTGKAGGTMNLHPSIPTGGGEKNQRRPEVSG